MPKGKKPSLVVLLSGMFYLVMMLLLLLNKNINAMMIPEPPAPQPVSSLAGATPGSLHPEECSPRCMNRCSKTAFKKPCMFFCKKCCEKCLCVPPGTYGNKESCPCYNAWKTKRGGPKCP